MNAIEQKLLDRFLRYVCINTQSDDTSTTFPSTQRQFDLLRILECELKEIGLEDVELDDKGYLMATIPATCNDIPVIGFIAHVDTSPEMKGEGVNPQIISKYDGEDIVLNSDGNIILSPAEFPELRNYVGQTLITTDGTTLLGADDKAGIAEIVTIAGYLTAHPEIKHGKIRIAFTPDEEIGKGADHFNVEKFGAKYAYTFDGAGIGELEYETFNAAGATVKIQGRNIHPGYAKGKMKNALLIAMEFNNMLPAFDKPQYTQDYEGFFHLIKMEGNVDSASMQYIVRDHNKNMFQQRKDELPRIAEFVNQRYGQGTIAVELKDQYYNMREMIEPVFEVVEIAIKAMEMAGVTPIIKPIRGGTDGARLSFMGLPTPNLFAGGHNFHGRFEFISLQSMAKAVEVGLGIIKLFSAKQS